MTPHNELRIIRKNLKIGQKQLAPMVGITVQYLGRIERGEVSPTMELLGRLFKAMGYEIKITINKI